MRHSVCVRNPHAPAKAGVKRRSIPREPFPSQYFAGANPKLREDVWFEKDESDQDIEKFYNLVCQQPANEDLPPSPELYTEDVVILDSKVLGVNLTVEVDSNRTSILVAESLLGALEAFLSTSLASGIIPHKQFSKVAVRVDQNGSIDSQFGIDLLNDSDGYDSVVVHSQEFSLDSAKAIQNFRIVEFFDLIFLPIGSKFMSNVINMVKFCWD